MARDMSWPREDPPARLNQGGQEPELRQSEVNGPTFDADLMGRRVDENGTQAQAMGRGWGLRRSPQEGFDAGDQTFIENGFVT